MKSNGQLRFYRAIWAEICTEQGWAHLPGDEKDAKRHALHAQLGLPESSTMFSRDDFTHWDRSTRHLRKASPHSAPGRRPSAPASRYDQAKWRIRHDAKLANFSDTYLNKIAYDRFSTLLWEDLTGRELLWFRNHIHDRASKKLGHDTRTRRAPVAACTADAGSVHDDSNEPF
jgi:hypothetical protein